MAHVRQSIRDNVVTAVTGLSTPGSNVFRLRKDERIANLRSVIKTKNGLGDLSRPFRSNHYSPMTGR